MRLDGRSHDDGGHAGMRPLASSSGTRPRVLGRARGRSWWWGERGWSPRPSSSSGALEEFTAQTLWEFEHSEELRTTDPRGMDVKERVDAAIGESSKVLESVLDVRFNGHDIESDYRPFGHEPHVLRVDGLVPRPGAAFGQQDNTGLYLPRSRFSKGADR